MSNYRLSTCYANLVEYIIQPRTRLANSLYPILSGNNMYFNTHNNNIRFWHMSCRHSTQNEWLLKTKNNRKRLLHGDTHPCVNQRDGLPLWTHTYQVWPLHLNPLLEFYYHIMSTFFTFQIRTYAHRIARIFDKAILAQFKGSSIDTQIRHLFYLVLVVLNPEKIHM